jgi:hypothetical protein
LISTSEAGSRVRLALWLSAPAIIDVLAVFAVLGAMLVANVEWVFTRTGWIDPWMYFGFFRHYDVSDYLAGNKKIARLPWILLGFGIHKLGDPVTVSFVLHAGLFALGAFCFYRLALRLFGRAPAAIATLTYITWVPMHGFGGWDYHNTLLPVVYLLCYQSLISATSTEGRPFARFLAFGALFALTVHTNLLALLLTPALALRGVHCARPWLARVPNARRWCALAAAGAAAGAVSLTSVFGLINLVSGRSFFFFEPLVFRSAFLLDHPGIEKVWWLPWSDPWWLSEIHTPMYEAVLVLIGITALASLPKWSVSGLLGSSSACALAEFVAALALFTLGQLLGHPLLQPFYMLFPTTIPMFLALAALLRRLSGDALSDVATTRLVLFAALAFGVQFVGRLSIDPALFGWHREQAWTNWPPLTVMLGGFLVAALSRRGTAPSTRAWLSLALVALALGQTNILWPIASDDRAPYDFRAPCAARRALVSAIAGADDVLFPLVRSGKDVLPWFRDREFAGPSDACRIASSDIGGPLYAMNYGVETGEHYWDVSANASMPQKLVDQLVPGKDVVAVITRDPAYVAQIVQHLDARDPAWREFQTFSIGYSDVTFGVHLISGNPALRKTLRR